jgi:hypothetical protein
MRPSHAFLKGRVLSLAASAVLTLVASGIAALADTPSFQGLIVDQVEEDWQLVVTSPDAIAVGPQITTVMSPDSGSNTPFIAFDLNYHEFPFFYPGGMQLQVWSGDNVLDTSSQGSSVLNTPNETVTWTQQIYVNGGKIVYNINNGSSTTWGQFGQGSNLQVSYPTTLADLSAYDPNYSAKSSGVTWESNRVSSLTLVRVRYYSNGQLILTNNNPLIVFSQDGD